jgi:alkylation response protein AidB-like acyl-CoA dehydrogenase
MKNIDSNRDEFTAAANAWLEANVPSRWRENRGALDEHESDQIRREWDACLYAGGYAGLSLPKIHGGQGLSMVEEVIFSELSARAQAPDGLARIGRILTAPTLVAHGNEEQLARYLPRLVNGDEIWCQGFSEPGAGSDLAGVTCSAKKVDGGYLISGRKTWTSFASLADRCLLLAQSLPDAGRYKNLSMFLLDMKQPGVRIEPIKQASGLTHFAEVIFEDAFVSDFDLVANDGDGWKIAMTVLTNERGAVEAASRYVEIRADMDLLNSALAGQPENRLALEKLDIRIEMIRWQTSKVIDLDESSEEFNQATSILKLAWSELWQEISNLGITTAGPKDYKHWRFQYLETRAATIYSGSNEIQRNIISDRILGLPR